MLANMYVAVYCQHADLMLGMQARHDIAARLMPLMNLEVASLLDHTGRAPIHVRLCVECGSFRICI